MCICNGTGGINIYHSWGVEFAPCPDTDCQFDRQEADRKYKAWWNKVEQQLNMRSEAI